MISQARTGDTVLVTEMTDGTQTLPWWLGGEGVKTTENKICWPSSFFIFTDTYLFLEDCDYMQYCDYSVVYFFWLFWLSPPTHRCLIAFLMALPSASSRLLQYMMKRPRSVPPLGNDPLTPNSALLVHFVLP
jgi:hypothetical protein